jgi:hypothetical protein
MKMHIYRAIGLTPNEIIDRAFGAALNMTSLSAMSGRGDSDVCKRNIGWLEHEMSKMQPDEVLPVRPEILIPIMDRLTYTSDENLAMAYVHLLAHFSFAGSLAYTHISYLNRLGEIGGDALLVLNHKREYADFIPFIEAIATKGGVGNQYRSLSVPLTGMEKALPLNVQQIYNILLHLEHCNLIDTGAEEHIASLHIPLLDEYDSFMQEWKVKVSRGEVPGMVTFKVVRSGYRLSDYCVRFLRCVSAFEPEKVRATMQSEDS